MISQGNYSQSFSCDEIESSTNPVKWRTIPFELKTTNKTTKVCKIKGVGIHFPYEKVYETQEVYMQDVLKTLNSRENALLESPTGTGKTMSLLCSTLAWLREFQAKCKKENNEELLIQTKIIYATRTHSQCKQIVEQLKKTSFNPTVCVLASRDHTCVKEPYRKLRDHSLVKLHGEDLRRHCKDARKSLLTQDQETREQGCRYYKPFLDGDSTKFAINMPPRVNITNEVRDIEEMFQLGKSCNFCPYYYERYLSTQADIIITPYNYLLDPNFRKMNNLNLENKIVIIDEAHNIEQAAEDTFSFTLTLEDVHHAHYNLKEILYNIRKLKTLDSSQLKNCLDIVTSLCDILEKFQQRLQMDGNPVKCSVNTIFEILHFVLCENKSPITYHTPAQKIYTALDHILQVGSGVTTGEGLSTLIKFVDGVRRIGKRYLDCVSGQSLQNNMSSYNLYFTRPTNKGLIIELRCLTPLVCFEDMQSESPRSIILTSGTLSPLKSMESLLGIRFKVQRVCKHVIDIKSQCSTIVIPTGLHNKELKIDLSYKSRGSLSIWQEIGFSVLDIIDKVDNGVILAFGSYELRNLCFSMWDTIYLNPFVSLSRKLNLLKPIYSEPENSSQLGSIMKNYFAQAKTKQGAILTCVCRGKVVEGIDFPDYQARAIIMIGVPLANFNTEEVQAKMKFLNYNKQKASDITGSKWYSLNGMRAANQAIGRVIRHENDYGMVFLFEWRYSTKFKNLLPSWINENKEVVENAQELKSKITTFFAEAKKFVAQKIIDFQEERKSNQAQSERTTLPSNQMKQLELTRFFKPQLKPSQTHLSNSKVSIEDKDDPVDELPREYRKYPKKRNDEDEQINESQRKGTKKTKKTEGTAIVSKTMSEIFMKYLTSK